LWLIFFGGIVLFGLLLWRRRLVLPRWSIPKPTWADGLTVLALVLIVWSVVVVKNSALGAPLTEWDGWAQWGFKAKFLYTDSIPNLGHYFQNKSLSFSHLDYPLLVAFLYSGCYAAMDGIDDELAKITLVFMFASYALFLYGVIRSFLPRAAARAATSGWPVSSAPHAFSPRTRASP
jgi:hypothetical protein